MREICDIMRYYAKVCDIMRVCDIMPYHVILCESLNGRVVIMNNGDTKPKIEMKQIQTKTQKIKIEEM